MARIWNRGWFIKKDNCMRSLKTKNINSFSLEVHAYNVVSNDSQNISFYELDV